MMIDLILSLSIYMLIYMYIYIDSSEKKRMEDIFSVVFGISSILFIYSPLATQWRLAPFLFTLYFRIGRK